MKISYQFDGNNYTYTTLKEEEEFKVSSLLTNNVGDFLFLGSNKNSIKSQGLVISNSKTSSMFKIINMIKPMGVETCEVLYNGYKVSRKFKSLFTKEILIEDENDSDENLNHEVDNFINDNLDNVQTTDSFYLAPSGGLIYEINNFDGQVEVDLDMRKLNDYSIWGRTYKSFKEDGILFVKYTKENEKEEDYSCYFGIKAVNFDYVIVDDWKEENFKYSAQRNSLSNWYIYKFLKVNVFGSKRLIIGSGFTKEEVISQISLLEKNGIELENIDKNIVSDLTSTNDRFEKLLSQDTSIAYSVSNNSLYNFYNSHLNFKNISSGSFAGYSWFTQVWSRDELIGIRALINNSEYNIVKERLFYYLDLIDTQTGLLPRINEKGSMQSCDGIFWLSKRFDDLIYDLEEKGRLSEVLTKENLNFIYEKLSFSFNKIISSIWDKDEELIKVKNGDSWMDTIEVEYPIDIQVQMLNFTSNLSVLSKIVGDDLNVKIYLDLENLLREKIREVYFRNGNLYQEKNKDIITSNVFLVYYIYPELFLEKDWEIIFDNALRVLWNNWGGISTISHLDSSYQENYTGENNLSYHRGDSWYFMNNISAMVLNHLNSKKYGRKITSIMVASTNDILKQGCIGFGSELSSSSTQKAQGSLAQLWSTSTYLEMIDKLFIRKL